MATRGERGITLRLRDFTAHRRRRSTFSRANPTANRNTRSFGAPPKINPPFSNAERLLSKRNPRSFDFAGHFDAIGDPANPSGMELEKLGEFAALRFITSPGDEAFDPGSLLGFQNGQSMALHFRTAPLHELKTMLKNRHSYLPVGMPIWRLLAEKVQLFCKNPMTKNFGGNESFSAKKSKATISASGSSGCWGGASPMDCIRRMVRGRWRRVARLARKRGGRRLRAGLRWGRGWAVGGHRCGTWGAATGVSRAPSLQAAALSR